MSFDDYANHIYQKHRLAIALAIIKSKPTHIPTTQYLEQLKSKIDNKMDDDDITVCSDDFVMDDDDEMNDSITILKDFDLENVICNDAFKDFDVATEVDVQNKKSQDEKTEALSQITYYDSQGSEIAETNINNTISNKENYNTNQNITIETTEKELNDKITNLNDHNYSKTNNNLIADLTNIPVNSQSTKNKDTTFYDSQKTIPYTVYGFTQNSHYSESQNNIVIPTKYIYGTNKSIVNQKNDVTNDATQKYDDKDDKNSNFKTNNNTETVKHAEIINSLKEPRESVEKLFEKHQNIDAFGYSQTMHIFSEDNDEDFDQIRNQFNLNIDIGNAETAKHIPKSGEAVEIQNVTLYSQNIDEYFDEMQNVDNFGHDLNTENTINTAKMDVNYNSLNQNLKTVNNDENKTKNIATAISKNTQNFTQISENHSHLCTVLSEHDRSVTEDHESEEIISFKVLKEFNKVKTFLDKPNRRMSCDGYSTDSGYRSDSQIRSVRGSLQLSGNWLNQSGCCLFNFIMQCPLVEGTREITNEIAEVLSQLIEKLHEDEKYPSFLEELLDAVDLLLRQVYEGVDNEGSEFLKKDEYIQRILLLNKSYHIQRHSIENISKILENFHSKITEPDSTYELTNIDEIENISYIFHILEILIKRHLKNKQILSQNSTQLSQEVEKHLKKSSITDIWRRKWNPSQKVFEGSREKKCVLKNCSEILNKIVVECVSDYSLVAYSALKCFNSMQS